MSAWTPDYEIGVVLDEQGRQIAAVSPRNREKHLKLIAAAPELADFIEMVRDAAADAMAEGETYAWAKETERRARALLAKLEVKP